MHAQSERDTEVVVAHIVVDGLGHHPPVLVAELGAVRFLVFFRQHSEFVRRDKIVNPWPRIFKQIYKKLIESSETHKP